MKKLELKELINEVLNEVNPTQKDITKRLNIKNTQKETLRKEIDHYKAEIKRLRSLKDSAEKALRNL